MTDQNKRTLELFVTKVNELFGCKLLQSKHQISFSFNVVGKQGRAITTLPNEESLRSFLLIFRNFYSPKENINFFKVCNLLTASIQDISIKKRVGEVRDLYQQILDKSPLSFVENSQSVSPNESQKVFIWFLSPYR